MIELVLTIFGFLCPYILCIVAGSIITAIILETRHWWKKLGYRERVKSQVLRKPKPLNPGLEIAHHVKCIDKLINAGLSNTEKIAVPMLLDTLVVRSNNRE